MGKPITKTFYDWCIENNRNDLLERWDIKLNKHTPKDVGFNSKQLIYFKCEKGTHKSEIHNLNSNNRTYKCRMCNSFYQWCIENDKMIYIDLWDYNKNMKLPTEVSCNSNLKWWFYCRNDSNHKGYNVTLGNLIRCKDGLSSCLQCNSLEKWCLNNNRCDILERWDDKLNKVVPSQIFKNSNIKVYLKCPNNKHDSEMFSLPVIVSARNTDVSGRCRKCNSFAQYLIDVYGDNALDKYWDYDRNNLDPWEIDKAARKYVWIKCQEKEYHGSYKVLCVSFKSKGCRCSYCNDTNTIHRLDSVGTIYPYIKDYWNDNRDIFTVAPHSGKKYNFKCKKHGKFNRTMADAIESNFICPECSRERNESLLEEKVRLYLSKKLKYNLNHEEFCSIVPINPKTNYKLPFDNEVVDLKLIIEVNGIQHYEICGFHMLQAKHNDTTPKEEFDYQQWKDRYKKEYALSLGYYYLEIPYWTEKDESYKILIDDKVNRILSESQKDSLLLCSNE